MQQVNIKKLVDKFSAGTCTEEELVILENWYLQWKPEHYDMDGARLDALMNSVWQEMPVDSKHKTFRLWPRITVAASRSKFGTSLIHRRKVGMWTAAAAVAAITLGTWIYMNEVASSRKAPRNDEVVMNDIAPGKNGATITLANGKVIQLSDTKTGVVIGNGRITYSSLRAGEAAKQSPLHDEVASIPRNDVMQMTATTAKGQTYQFTLPDGTKVWLNADSKISFPSQFPGEERKILLDGEGYFEVSKSYTSLRGRRTKQSFVVESKGQTVEVLGTHFNINSYADGAGTKTTLLEGSVKVSSLRGGTTRQSHDEVAASRRAPRNDGEGGEGNDVVLKPNQQSIQTPSGEMQVRNVDVSEALDWKNGDFIFKQEPLAVIMRRVSRWYDVDVVYDKDVDQQQTFGGKVSRKRNISQVIKALQATQALKFRIEGKKVYINN